MNKPLKLNQKGQGTVEFILLAAITVSISLGLVHFLRDKQFAQKLIGNPWSTLSGMIECGTWSGCGAGKHPSSAARINSYRPGS